jgi:hypothetical protein
MTKNMALLKKEPDKIDPLPKYAAGGFLNLSKDVVDAMIGTGLKWGATGRAPRILCTSSYNQRQFTSG